MNPFKYEDEYISRTEFMIAIPAMIIGVTVLSLPGSIAKATLYSDGWLVILISVLMFTVMAILATKLAVLFPGQSFLSYTSYLVTKPVATIITFIYSIIAILLSAYSICSVAFISQEYLFEQTPMEVLGLLFLLVVVYAVSGSRAGIFRLNILFLPIILFVVLFIILFNIHWFEAVNFLPMFQTNFKSYIYGIKETFNTFVGYGIILFYVSMLKKHQHLSKRVIIGMSIPIVLYIAIFLTSIGVFGHALTDNLKYLIIEMSIPIVLYISIYLTSIGVFGHAVTANLKYPMIELAKRIDVPGGIFERVDAFIFTIWMMAIFNTVAITFDVAVYLLSSIFKRIEKKLLTFILSPIVFYISMFPQQIHQMETFGRMINHFTGYFTIVVIIGLLLIAKIRGVNSDAK